VLNKILRFFERTLCKHPTSSQIRRLSNGVMWVECLDCGDRSPGVTVAGKVAA
jgi:hypothetical protein